MATKPDVKPDAIQHALGASAFAAAVIDLEGRYVHVNDAFAKIAHTPAPDLVGSTIDISLDDPDERARGLAELARLARGEVDAIHVEWRHRFPSGQEAWLDISASRMRSADGGVEQILVIAVDITERRLEHEHLAHLQHRNELILNAVTEGVLGLDAAGRITFINNAAARILGYTSAEVLGKDRHALIHHARSEGVPYPESKCPISATLHDGTVHHASGEVFWRKDGKPVPVDYTSAPIREDGNLSGVAVIFADVSERSGAADATRRANQKVLDVYDRIPEAFFAVDQAWNIVYMNSVAERLRRMPKEAVMGKNLWDTFPDLKGSRFDVEYHRAMTERTVVHIEEHYPRLGMWFEATAYPTEEGLSVFFRDVTVKKRLEEESKAASIARPLVRRIVQDLVETGGVAHQILQQVGRKLAGQTPATGGVQGYLDAYIEMGLGRVEVEKEEGQRYAFRGTDLLEKQPGSRVATCSFTLGYLSEAVSRTNRSEPTLGTEIECQSRGAAQCRFIIQVKKQEEGLARRVKELV